MTEAKTRPSPPGPCGRHLPPDTIRPLKGKPETGMYAAGMGRDDRPGHPWARGPHAPTFDAPQQTIRFPYAAPFEPVLSPS